MAYHNSTGGYYQFQRSDSSIIARKRLQETLDHVESRIHLLREHAVAVKKEKEDLERVLTSMQSNKDFKHLAQSEKEELEITVQNLSSRLLTVEVTVTIPRNEYQQKALEKIYSLIDNLQDFIQNDKMKARVVLTQYINSCMSESVGPINPNFQGALLECTLDDQKATRKRLEALLCSL